MSDNSQQTGFKLLLEEAKRKNYLLHEDLLNLLPNSYVDPEKMEEIISILNEMGIKVYEKTPDEETLLLDTETNTSSDEINEAIEVLATETRTTDPVRMYMREMGTVELLTREGEIVIAKRIEEGLRELMKAMACFPGTVSHILKEYDGVDTEERRLSDIITGYLSADDGEIIPAALVEAEVEEVVAVDDVKDDDDEVLEAADEEEGATGPDPEEARLRFTELREQFQKTEAVIKKHGRSHKKTLAELDKLGDCFKTFKLTPKQFEPLLGHIRVVLQKVRRNERTIMTLCVRNAGMPRKTFIQTFPGNEVNEGWVDSL